MASTNSVPTKAAMHAIRGLLFTTSCSVVLLAEERRRRIKIARNALENARKIHTAKSHRSAVALGGEAIGSWEYRLNEDQEIVKIPHRRRRQSIGHAEGRTLKGRASEAGLSTPTRSDLEPMLRAASEALLQEALGLGSLSLLHSPSTRPKQHDTRDTPISRHTTITPLTDKSTESTPGQKAADLQAKLQALAIDLGRDTEASPNPKAAAVDTIKNARLYLLATSDAKDVSVNPDLDDGLAILSQLVSSLYSQEIHQDASEDKFELALGVLQRLASSSVPRVTADVQLRPMCLALLQHAAARKPERLEAIFDSIAKVFKQINIFYPFMSWLRAGNYSESIESLLAFLSRPHSASEWSCGQFITRYFEREFSHGRSYTEMKELYHSIDSAGYFSKFSISPKYECKLRAFAILRAVEAGDDVFAATEIERLRELFPEYLEDSLALQAAIVLQLARSSQWLNASAMIHRLAATHGATSKGFRKMLSRTTDVVAERRSPEELEAWLQDTVISFGLHVNRRWGGQASHGGIAGAETDAFTDLKKLVDEEKWDELCETYSKMWEQGQITSSKCLGLGIIGHLRADEGRTARAAALADAAVAKGQDVTFAVTPLQLAQIEEGADVEELIATSLNHGVHIDDCVYNKASRRLSKLGRWQAAINVCETAARENGNGDVLYNETNFSNLIYAYSGSMRYEPLSSVLDIFTADSASWHGSPICKESIKFAMKAVAMRVVTAESVPESKRHREALDKLDAALRHVQICRRQHASQKSNVKAKVRLTTPSNATQSPSYGLFQDGNIKATPEGDCWTWSSVQRELRAEQG
ncbi:hypothetical protein K4F52_009881 [Lecanicillium sp. MT-2017a]|nr:hypothetical protein K4F52_009881 [Lecanicillium sp. MT-2017a]